MGLESCQEIEAMARLPRYTSLVRTYEEALEHILAEGNKRQTRLKTDLQRSLLQTLITGNPPLDDNFPRRLQSILRKVGRQVAKDDFSLPKAFYEMKVYGASPKAASDHWGLNWRDIRTLDALWKDSGFTVDEYKKLIGEIEPDWVFDVEERHEEIVIWLDDRAIEDIVLVALEAYTVPRKGLKFTETYGICFGTVKSTEQRRQTAGRFTLRHIDIRSVHTQLRAIGFSNKVTYDLRSLETQMAVASYLFPKLDIVGDFHTHPYETAEELRQVEGWHFSPSDEACIPEWVQPLKQMGYYPRTSLIVGIAEGTKRISRPGRLKPNVVRFSVSKYHFYIACYRIIGNRYSDRHISVNAVAVPIL